MPVAVPGFRDYVKQNMSDDFAGIRARFADAGVWRGPGPGQRTSGIGPRTRSEIVLFEFILIVAV